MSPDKFFENMNIKSQNSNYSVLWNRQNLSKKNLHERFTKIANYSDLKVFDILSEWIPKKYDIQVFGGTKSVFPSGAIGCVCREATHMDFR